MRNFKTLLAAFISVILSAPHFAFASEADLRLPSLDIPFAIGASTYSGVQILYVGIAIALFGIVCGMVGFAKIKALPAHRSMLEVSSLIYETCKTYLFEQIKFIAILELVVGACIVYYYAVLQGAPTETVLMILGWSILGIAGSVGVAWFGIRLNTYANSRVAFASLMGKPYPVMHLPLRAGMAVGVMIICVELILLSTILLFVPAENQGSCFIGFAIGASLGAAALRICGGIFTKIADIGADLMKIVFNIKEDDARNPGVIADCAGDNAGDSVGPTADGFETYGVTAVALISFISLAVGYVSTGLGATPTMLENAATLQAQLIVWMFAMAGLMIAASLLSYVVTNAICKAKYSTQSSFDFEAPLTMLVWIASLVSMAATFGVSNLLISSLGDGLWWKLSLIISCGTLAGALIPEFTKIFTSSKSKHVEEIVSASREGGASLTILSGLVAGNFSAFWKGLVMVGLMFVAYLTSDLGLSAIMIYPAVFAFGLVAFGFLSMGPVTIAVDGYGPVADNAQSVFELSQIETLSGISAEIEKDYGFTPNFSLGKDYLEQNDSAGNTFKATAKPVLIGTAVIGATTMIFSVILKLNIQLNMLDPKVLLGLLCGGAVIYWFSGASIQAVSTGAYRAVEYIKANIKLESSEKASVKDSKEVVKICTQYAQAGMKNIFGVIFCLTLAFACFDKTFFAAYLMSIAIFGLFQAMFMANAGGAWDNAKKYVEVDLKEKGTPLHAATVVGDTVGDPFKDTSSVALNPIIKFTTLFGLLAVEIAVNAPLMAPRIGMVMMVLGLYFVWRSFYRMRITTATLKKSNVTSIKEKRAQVG